MKKKTIGTIVTMLTILSLLTGCGSDATSSGDGYNKGNNVMGNSVEYTSGAQSSSSIFGFDSYNNSYSEDVSADYEYNDDYVAESGQQISEGHDNTSEITLSQEKLVYTCDISIETTEYSDTMSKIQDLIKSYNGVVQSMSESDNAYDWYYSGYEKKSGTLSCYIQMRIPADKYEEFTNGLGDVGGKVISKNQSVDNISQQYFDTEITIASLEKEESKLLEMMDKASTIEEMIQIESRLQEVDAELMRNKTDMKYMDLDVAYSYVNISVREVVEYTKDDENRKTNTFLDRLKNTLEDTVKGLGNNLENLLFFIIMIVPYIIIVVAILLIYNKILKDKVKSLKRKRRERKESEDKEEGTLTLKEMNNMINNLNNELESRKKSDSK